MGLIKKVTRKSVIVILPLILLSFLVDWSDERLKFVGLFGSSGFMTTSMLMAASILIGSVIGLANFKGLLWSIESLLGTHRASTRMVFLSLLRLFILFGIVIILVILRLINLFGFLIGITVVFLVLIMEALKIAKAQGEEGQRDGGEAH